MTVLPFYKQKDKLVKKNKDNVKLLWAHVPRMLKSVRSVLIKYHLAFGPQREKTCLWGFANNTGTDQPARMHPRRLISAFVICFLERIICKLGTGGFF